MHPVKLGAEFNVLVFEVHDPNLVGLRTYCQVFQFGAVADESLLHGFSDVP